MCTMFSTACRASGLHYLTEGKKCKMQTDG
jgi:hypothetical protein